MAADDEIVEETTTEEAPAEETREETPDLAAQLEAERIARARAEGELTALRDRKPEPPKSDAFDLNTIEGVEAAYKKGLLDDGDRTRRLARIEARQEIEAQQREQHTQRLVDDARDKAAKLLDDYPGLADPATPLGKKAIEKLRGVVQSTGLDGKDPRALALALELAVGGGPTVDAKEYERRRRPSSGPAGGGDAGEGGGKPDPLKSVPAEIMQHWKSLNYSREQMLAEAPYVRRAPRRVPA